MNVCALAQPKPTAAPRDTTWRHCHHPQGTLPKNASSINRRSKQRTSSAASVHAVLHCTLMERVQTQRSGCVIIPFFLLPYVHTSLYLAARHQKGSSSGTPAGVITNSQQWLCEKWEDWITACCHKSSGTHADTHLFFPEAFHVFLNMEENYSLFSIT